MEPGLQSNLDHLSRDKRNGGRAGLTKTAVTIVTFSLDRMPEVAVRRSDYK